MVYVANSGSDTVSVINGLTNNVAISIPAGKNPIGISVNPSSHMVYVANSGSNTVSVIHPSVYGKVYDIKYVYLGHSPYGISVDPNSNTAYVTNSLSNTVSVINCLINKVANNIQEGKNPIYIYLDI